METILIGTKQGDSTYFDDSVDLLPHQPFKVRFIKVFFSNDAILGLQVTYYSYKSQKVVKGAKHRYSKMFGTRSLKMTLVEDEFIVKIEGHSTDKSIHRLNFRTNKD
jgi:hypothetical protein